jgi:hypothetical protein
MKKQKSIDLLMLAMDACAVARGEAQWTQGYRTKMLSNGNYSASDEASLYRKEQEQWRTVERFEKKFRRLALRILREHR